MVAIDGGTVPRATKTRSIELESAEELEEEDEDDEDFLEDEEEEPEEDWR